MAEKEYTPTHEMKQGAVQRAVETLPPHVRTRAVADQFGHLYDRVRSTREVIYEETRTADRGVPPHQVREAMRHVVDDAQQQ